MISTVTVSTVSTVTTALAGSGALIGVVVLFILLLQKEVTTASDSSLMHRLGTALNIGIIPLLIAFILIVIAKVLEVLR
jgi:Ca2+/H+ antiporter